MIVQTLNHRGVEYVAIGGSAGEQHAAAVPPTRDIDVTPRATPANLGRLSQALADLDARIRTEGVPEGLPSPTALHRLPTLAPGTHLYVR